ncbi:MAG TPA: tetratricopeptide repeat protein [Bryobacteraceae bacterium]|nr:tetratricopeptide repeat protein [Bryobacteraceae bacterium]
MWLVAALLFLQAGNPVSDGMKALEEGKYEAAAQFFTKAIESDPKDYAAHFNLGLTYSYLHRDAEGIAEYRKALALKPGLVEAQLNEGILLLRQKNAAEALPLLQAAATQKPKDFRPRFYLAEAELATGAAEKAEESYRAAIELDGHSAAAQLGLGRALAQEGKLAEAGPYFQAAAQLDAHYRDALLELAALYEKNRQVEDAAAIYRQFPDNPKAQERLGELLIESKQYADAIPRLEAAYAKTPDRDSRLALAQAYLANNEPAKAAPLLEKAVAEEPDNYNLHVLYGHSLRDQRQFPAAAAQFAAALQLKPNEGHLWNELGGALYMAEDYPRALAAFDRALQLGEDIAGNWFLRAIILDKLHQLKPAVEAYQRFLSMSQGKNPDQEFQARQRVRILNRELEKR